MSSAPLPFDPFTLLGLPRRYDLHRRAIEAAHLRRLAVLHPDRVADPLRQAQAQQESAALNDARTILLDAERRADALLALLGGPAREADRSLPEGYLMEVMALRERLERGQSGEAPEIMQAIEEEVRDRRARHRAEASRLFDIALGAEDPAGQNPAVLRRIRLELNAWRYIERLRGALRE
jgi:molecular chaperone HscB